jgi:hypothetical protein
LNLFTSTNIPADQPKDNLFEVIKALGEIGATTKKILALLEKGDAAHTEIMTLVPSAFKPFKTEGYTFNSVYVSDASAADAVKLVIKFDGIQYSKALTAGENIVNIPNASEISVTTTSGSAAQISLVRYNKDRI